MGGGVQVELEGGIPVSFMMKLELSFCLIAIFEIANIETHVGNFTNAEDMIMQIKRLMKMKHHQYIRIKI